MAKRKKRKAYVRCRGGSISCTYGCLGCGLCVSACRLNAISIGDGGIAEIDMDECVGCGLCSRICPQHNIALRGNRVVIGKKCTNCLRCLHFCPHQALEFVGIMKATAVTKEYQYHHPDICVQDFDREG